MCNSIHGLCISSTRRNININPPQVMEMYKVVIKDTYGGYRPIASCISRPWKSQKNVVWNRKLVYNDYNVGFCCYPKLLDAQECASWDWDLKKSCVVKVAVKDMVAVYRTKDVIGEWQWVALVKMFKILEEVN